MPGPTGPERPKIIEHVEEGHALEEHDVSEHEKKKAKEHISSTTKEKREALRKRFTLYKEMMPGVVRKEYSNTKKDATELNTVGKTLDELDQHAEEMDKKAPEPEKGTMEKLMDKGGEMLAKTKDFISNIGEWSKKGTVYMGQKIMEFGQWLWETFREHVAGPLAAMGVNLPSFLRATPANVKPLKEVLKKNSLSLKEQPNATGDESDQVLAQSIEKIRKNILLEQPEDKHKEWNQKEFGEKLVQKLKQTNAGKMTFTMADLHEAAEAMQKKHTLKPTPAPAPTTTPVTTPTTPPAGGTPPRS
jgi:hypothetical protein